jgi:hypothetical protein
MRNVRSSGITLVTADLHEAFTALATEQQRLRADDGRWRPHVRRRLQALKYRLRQLITEQPYLSRVEPGEVLAVDPVTKRCRVQLVQRGEVLEVPFYPPAIAPRVGQRYNVYFEERLPLKTVEDDPVPEAVGRWLRTGRTWRLYSMRYRWDDASVREVGWFPWPLTERAPFTPVVRLGRYEWLEGVTGVGHLVVHRRQWVGRAPIDTLTLYDMHSGERVAVRQLPADFLLGARGWNAVSTGGPWVAAVDSTPGSGAILLGVEETRAEVRGVDTWVDTWIVYRLSLDEGETWGPRSEWHWDTLWTETTDQGVTRWHQRFFEPRGEVIWHEDANVVGVLGMRDYGGQLRQVKAGVPPWNQPTSALYTLSKEARSLGAVPTVLDTLVAATPERQIAVFTQWMADPPPPAWYRRERNGPWVQIGQGLLDTWEHMALHAADYPLEQLLMHVGWQWWASLDAGRTWSFVQTQALYDEAWNWTGGALVEA